MPYQVTVQTGLKDVVLPNGFRAQGGDVVTLSDVQFAMLSPTARDHGVTTLFSAINNAPVLANEILSAQSTPMAANWTEAMNPAGAGTDVPSTQTTPYSVPTNQNTLEIG